MSNANETQNKPAPREIDIAALDQVVGAGIMVPEARKQEQADKLTSEQDKK